MPFLFDYPYFYFRLEFLKCFLTDLHPTFKHFLYNFMEIWVATLIFRNTWRICIDRWIFIVSEKLWCTTLRIDILLWWMFFKIISVFLTVCCFQCQSSDLCNFTLNCELCVKSSSLNIFTISCQGSITWGTKYGRWVYVCCFFFQMMFHSIEHYNDFEKN